MNDYKKHYSHNQQTAMKEVISRLSHIKNVADTDPYMNKLKESNKTRYNEIGDIKRFEINALKTLENYLKKDTHPHKKEINKLEKAIRQNEHFKSW
jgi:hypothetical protein